MGRGEGTGSRSYDHSVYWLGSCAGVRAGQGGQPIGDSLRELPARPLLVSSGCGIIVRELVWEGSSRRAIEDEDSRSWGVRGTDHLILCGAI